MLLCVDIGNTNITIGVFDKDKGENTNTRGNNNY